MTVQEVVTRNESGEIENYWYVLSRSQTKFKEITDSLVIKFEQLRKGQVPDHTGGKYEKMLEIRNAMHVVVQTNAGALSSPSPVVLHCIVFVLAPYLNVCCIVSYLYRNVLCLYRICITLYHVYIALYGTVSQCVCVVFSICELMLLCRRPRHPQEHA